jgi:lipid-A-disaccharide synthase
MRIGILAGEASGDLLGTGLIQAIKQQVPEAQFEGIAGPGMMAQGAKSLFPMDRLSVMGLTEVLSRYFELLGIRNQLARHFIANPPDVFIGIDAPDFNLGLEIKLRKAGIKTVHYVSPSVWAWRQYRVKKIARAVDLMLTLFPFEADFYRDHQVPVTFVGHPLADMIELQPDQSAYRQQLQLPQGKQIVAILPGSRSTELRYLADDFLQAAAWLMERQPGLHFVAPMANPQRREQFEAALSRLQQPLPLTILDGQSRAAMAAADVVILASGTAALEAMLLKKPMVVAYRVASITYWAYKPMMRISNFCLPNLLAGETLVPEFIQHALTPEAIGSALLDYLQQPQKSQQLAERFLAIHKTLKQDASAQAARAILSLLETS